jgi:Ribosomal protein S1
MAKENTGDNAALDTKWTKIEEHFRKDLPVTASVVKATLEYMLVDVDGISGVVELPAFDFAPLGEHAHDHDHIRRQLELMCGRKMSLTIVEFDRSSERLLLKPHMYMFDVEDEQSNRVRELLQKMQPGDLHTVVVDYLGPLHATVDLNGIEGRVPLFYLSRAPVYHTRKILRMHQVIDVMVLDVQDTWCELSMVHAQMFEAARRHMKPGEVRQGRIVSLRAEGVYLDLGDIIGLLPVELAVSGYITHPADLYHRGQEMTVRIDYVTAEYMPILSRMPNN